MCVQARVREDLVMDILWNISAGHIPHIQQSHLLCVYQPTPQPNTNTDGPGRSPLLEKKQIAWQTED